MGYAILKQESTVTTLDFMGHCRGALQVYWFVWCPSIQNSGEGNYVQGQGKHLWTSVKSVMCPPFDGMPRFV